MVLQSLWESRCPNSIFSFALLDLWCSKASGRGGAQTQYFLLPFWICGAPESLGEGVPKLNRIYSDFLCPSEFMVLQSFWENELQPPAQAALLAEGRDPQVEVAAGTHRGAGCAVDPTAGVDVMTQGQSLIRL